MATFNLVRNSRLFYTTNVALGTGVVAGSGFTTANTQEIQVLDGFSFSQASNADTITIAEAGSTPTRGQRAFNTSLNNVEFSFSTYLRPRLSTTVKAEEAVLWNSLLGTTALGTAAAFTATGITTASVAIDAAGIITIPGTGMVVTGIAVGEIVTIKGVTGVGAYEYNSPVKILTASATSITAQYLTKPQSAVVTASWSTAVTFNKTAWNEYPAITSDTTAPQVAGLGATYSAVTTAASNKNQLLPFGMIVTVDGVTYIIDNAVMDQAVIDFGLDGIAMVAWTGKGTVLRQLSSNVLYSAASDPVLSGGLTGTATGKITTANYITNKLSSLSVVKNIGGIGAGNTSYTLALTGGSITIANNITYVTPANLGVVNVPIGYFTGTRAITGTLNAYLRTGATNSAGLLADLLAASATSAGTEPKFRVEIDIGGSTAGTRIEVEMNGCNLQIPTIDAQAVMSTSINFTAQGTDPVLGATAGYDIENTNDLEIRYLSL
jgi:hypothetical protein